MIKVFKEFKEFCMRGNVVELAVGVIIGAAFTSIVDSVVKDLINPVIGLLIGGIDFSNMFVTLKAPAEGASFPTLQAAQAAGAVTINYGMFINASIKFAIVAFVVFMLVKSLNKLLKPTPGAPVTPPRQEILLEEIRDLLKRN
ncbi:MAG: large conductance mechanosensitive channel protein MscL [Alphaproteobacteria bacterium]|nr:large conductance mechanosensitive channel protein MscL [Alphaproteobacteria bacterium]